MKHQNTHVVLIIPAKTDSTRLPKKNLRSVCGKTLIEHSIDHAKQSKYVKSIIVSTESEEVAKICQLYDNILILNRPAHLLKDAEVADVYVDVFQNQLKDNSMPTHMVALQPDHPDRKNNLDDMIDYFIENKYDDLVTVDSFGTRNGSVRITKAEYVRDGSMSRRVGSFLDDCTNIHGEDDLKTAEGNINERVY